MIRVKRSEVEWLSRHVCDNIGETFCYNDRIFRVIKPEREDFVKQLLENHAVQQAMREGLLVSTKVTEEFAFEGEEERLYLENKKTAFMIYPYEWTPYQHILAKDCVEKLQLLLISGGLYLSDPHKYNVGFNGSKAVYLDFGSIFNLTKNHLHIWDYHRNIWGNPYRLFRDGKISYVIFRNIHGPISDEEYHELNGKSYSEYFHSDINEQSSIIELLQREQEYTSAELKRDIINKGVWSDYQKQYFDENGNLKSNNRWDYYVEIMQKLFKEKSVNTVLEIAGNSGAFSQYIYERGLVENVCVTDRDTGALDFGMQQISDKDISSSIYFANRNILLDKEFAVKSPYDRYKADLVFALALTHHLLLSQGIKRSVIVDSLYQYSKEYVITEFMPLGLWGVGDEIPENPEWYTLEWFLDGFREKFEIIETQQIQRNRIAVIMKKK